MDTMNRLTENGAVQPARLIPHSGPEAYEIKPLGYLAGARFDYVAALPENPDAKILEVGCGEGETGALALLQGKCAVYCGVEICDSAAEKARGKISEVLVGNIEELELPWGSRVFDALILSEVLEHLVDPWSTLRKIRSIMKPGSLVFASSPNVSYYKLIAMLMRGEWTLTDSGHMDRTHLRWFTPKTYREMFESCGYCVDSVQGKVPLRPKGRLISLLSFNRLRHLFIYQIDLRAHCL